jgi:hypothetical protein
MVVTDRQDRWPLLLLPFAAWAAGLYLVVRIRRRLRTRKHERPQPEAGIVDRFSGLVALCAGVFALVTQFFPGVGVNHHPPPSAAMEIRHVNARVTRGAYSTAIGANARVGRLYRREPGDVIWLELVLGGYQNSGLNLFWMESEPGYDGLAIPGTATTSPLRPPAADAVKIMLPVWVDLPKRRFQVRFYLTNRHGGLLQVATTPVLRGLRYPYVC